jgi:hypothetical protein
MTIAATTNTTTWGTTNINLFYQSNKSSNENISGENKN